MKKQITLPGLYSLLMRQMLKNNERHRDAKKWWTEREKYLVNIIHTIKPEYMEQRENYAKYQKQLQDEIRGMTNGK